MAMAIWRSCDRPALSFSLLKFLFAVFFSYFLTFFLSYHVWISSFCFCACRVSACDGCALNGLVVTLC